MKEDRMNLPPDKGYSVADGLVHTRYPTHPTKNTPRKARTLVAVHALLPDPSLCPQCYPQESKQRGRNPVSRSPRSTMRQNRGASSQPLSDAPSGMGAPPRHHLSPRLRLDTPEAPGADADSRDAMPLLRPSSDADQPDHAGPPDPSGERRESGAEQLRSSVS